MHLLFSEHFDVQYNDIVLVMKDIIVLLSVVVLCDGAAQTCTNNLKWPSEASSGTFSGYTSYDAELDSGYLMEAVEYHTPDDCTCGLLYKWIFHPQAPGPIEFQVWEHLDHQSYKLKGENYFTVPTAAVGETIEFLVPERDRITIRNNYLIGWYGAASGIIGYKEDDEAYSDEARREPNMGNLDPSHEPTFDWSSGSSVVHADRIYAIRAESYSNTAPEFTNLPREVWIYGDATAGAYIYQVAADDIDPKDVSTLFVYDIAEDSTKIVYLAVSRPAIGTYSMTFEVQDQCLNTNQATLTIIVKNWAPSLTNLPSFASISESTTNEVALFTIQFTDKDNTTLDEKYALNVSPTNSDISIKYVGHDKTNRSVVSARSTSYDYTIAQQYIIDITLEDGEFDTDKGYFMLYITKNDPPKFTNLENGAQANISYVTTAAGDTVYAVSVTDAENDALTFTMTCDPVGCPLEIDGDNGVISANQDFVGNIYGTGWDLSITVSDGVTTTVARSLSVIVHDINDVPQIVNLGLSDAIAVHEGTALGTVVYTVSYIDLDTADTHTFHATYNPTLAANYFEMNITSGTLTTANNVLDYEELDPNWSIVVTVTVSDGIDRATGTLTILIRNVNEAPYFHQTKYTLEPPEEGTFGASAGDWRPGLSDPDLDIDSPLDTHAYTWDCGIYTRYFRMARVGGAVTYATKFDYDSVSFTAPYDCVVTVTDKAGLSATTTLEIDIHDVNDNTPVFVTTTDNYIFQTPSLDPGRLVGQVTATDKDRSTENNRIYYSFHTTPFTKNFLLINDYGNIYVNETWVAPQFNYGISYVLIVKAENVKDEDGTVRSATATVTLFLSGTTTPEVITTDRPFKFVEDNRNIAWLAVALTFGGVLLVIVCGFMMMYTIQIKRYRWCIPWCRKHLLGLKKMTRREKRRYYRGLLMQAELDETDDDSNEEHAETALQPDHGDSDDETAAPPMLWDRLKARGDPITRGPTVRKPGVPRAAVYDEPKPQLKKNASEMLKASKSNFWT
ncbi:cadherin-related family member 2-like isoform X2 [Mercenaria mercenaria]|uniref:cadherin-related family member 2-like isoform X2 n=1 Tax=Mercenaria mercenaria TaxID=6596 RepID=UPI00234E7027|nr:cadherin-related family member 2-like isoform X2 [Mercenaria mercenaria]